jgi:hypothetical protein
MIEFRETGLPFDADVYKAFSIWRLNAKDFAERSGLSEDYPLKVAQLAASAEPENTGLITLAMLMSVPTAAWGVVQKNFGAKTVETLAEAWRHVRTGYAYVDEASDDVKGLALAAACTCFDKFIRTAPETGPTMISQIQLKKDPSEILRSLLGPECRVYERLGDKIRGYSPALTALYEEKLSDYNDARADQNDQLAELGVMIADGEQEPAEAGKIVIGYPPFEMTGLIDDPMVRAAYDVLISHTRVQPDKYHDAMTVGLLLTEENDALAVATGLLDAGVGGFTPDDFAFLGKKLDPAVIDMLENYNVMEAFTRYPEMIAECPRSVQHLALARGIVLMAGARHQSEDLMEMIEQRAAVIPPEMQQQLRQQGLMPVLTIAEVIPYALEPLIGKSGAPKLESQFSAGLKDLQEFVARQAGAAEKEPPMAASRKPPTGPGFRA